MANLTPYDRGTVLEPKPWVRKGMSGEGFRRPASEADYGRVDFTNDEDATVLIIDAAPAADDADVTVINIENCFEGPLRIVVDGKVIEINA